MRMLVALTLMASMVSGCCVVGMTVGADRASSHNDEVARKLERGERLDADDKVEPMAPAAVKGFVLGAAIDLVALAVIASSAPHVGGNLLGND